MFTEMLLGKQAKQAALDQQAEEFKARQQERNLQSMQSSMGQIGSALDTLKNDQTANQVMSGQDGMDHTGGMRELKLNLAMDQNRRANLGIQLQQDRLNAMNDYRQVQAANAASRLVNQKDKDVMNASMAYFRNLGVNQRAVSNAITNGDQNAYMQAAQTIQGLYHGMKAMGFKDLQEPQIPDFQAGTPEHTEGGIFGLFGHKVPATPAIKAPAFNGGDPSASAQPSDSGDLLSMARAAIQQGADKSAVIQRLQSMGFDASFLNNE